MSIFSDVFSLIGGGSRPSATATANNSTSVSVNPTIMNTVDLSALATPVQNLVNAFDRSNQDRSIDANVIATAIRDTGATQSKTLTDTFTNLATYVALGTLGLSLWKMVRG
jgi:NAD-dependent DNA ligase